MAYTYDPIFAADPNNPATVAKDATITIFNPADPTKAAVTITDPTGSPLANPMTVNGAGFGPAFQHATLDRVGWTGAGFVGYFTSYEGMREEAQAAKTAAQAAQSIAQTVETRAATGEFKGQKGDQGAPGPQGPAGISNVALDTDGIPYFAAGSNAVQILADTDGAPYYV
jgi:hypothetical protein